MRVQDKKMLYIVGMIIAILIFIHNPFSGYWDSTSNPWFNGSLLTACADEGHGYCKRYQLPFWGWRSTGALIDWFATVQNLFISIAVVVVVAGAVRGFLNVKEKDVDE